MMFFEKSSSMNNTWSYYSLVNKQSSLDILEYHKNYNNEINLVN